MSGETEELKALFKYNPAALQAKLYRWSAVALTVIVLCLGSYFYGRHDGKMASLDALKTVAARVADQRADNAIDATKRLGDYTVKDRALEVGIADALDQVRAYYAQPQEPRTIEKTKLVTVPGQKELVYVPTGACPSDYFSPDELQLFNVGNKRGDLDTGNSGGILKKMP